MRLLIAVNACMQNEFRRKLGIAFGSGLMRSVNWASVFALVIPEQIVAPA